MGLQTKITIEELENSFFVHDCTGMYTGDNKGGYGGPNPKIDRVVANILQIEPPNSKTPYPISLDVSSYLPNKDGIPMEIFPSQVDQTGQMMESGKYKFKYITTTENSAGQQTTVESYSVNVFTKDIACCIDKHADCLTANAFKDDKQKKIIELSNLLDGINYLVNSGNYDKADETIDYVKSQCKCQNC